MNTFSSWAETLITFVWFPAENTSPPPLFFVVMMEEFFIFVRSTVNGEPNQPRKREKYKFHKSTRGEGGNVGELFAKSFLVGIMDRGRGLVVERGNAPKNIWVRGRYLSFLPFSFYLLLLRFISNDNELLYWIFLYLCVI